MANYNAPGVYIKDVVSGSQTISQSPSSVGVLVGVTRSGTIGVAQKIGSWNEFIEKYANGLDTPFMTNSFLPYSVFGYFQNGGKELYIVSVKKNGIKASATTTAGIAISAKSEGAWGNSISVAIAKSEDWSAQNLVYDVTVSVGTTDSVTITDTTLATISGAVLSNSKAGAWLSVFNVADVEALAVENVSLANGSDGDALTDTDYINALSAIDLLDDATLVGIPGQTSNAVNAALMTYCDNEGLFPILDLPVGSTPAEAKAYRKSVSAFTGALCYPWGKVNDPLTNTLKAVPTCGHVMGVYARIIESRGVAKAPAGVEAVVRGFIETYTVLTESDLSSLNPVGVICIVARPNAGIVIWGARSLNSTDSTMRYVSDGLLNLNIKKSLYTGTQFAVFEPNNTDLWKSVETTCKSFLETLRAQGLLRGTPEEAYYVTVDDSNNTEATINAGELNIEVGYAPIKPAEFVIIKLAHSIESAE